MKMKPKKFLYREWAEEWLLNKKDFVKESTYANYATVLYNHLIPDLGETSLQSVNHNMLQQYILDKLKSGRIGENSHLSEKTVKDIMMVLKSTIRYAMNQGAMNVIDLDFTYPKNTKKKKIYILTKKEQKKITDYVLENLTPRNLGILISLYSGMRIGEICALKWEDIDFSKKAIRIQRSMEYRYSVGEWRIGEPKSKAGYRTIPLTDETIRILTEQKEKNKNIKKIQEEWYEFIFLSRKGEPVKNSAYDTALFKICDKAKINRFSMHVLRHTFATRCIEGGMMPKTLQKILGHSNIGITMNLYVHITEDEKQKEIDKVSCVLNVG